MMKEDFDYYNYVVAFIDVLGQKEAFEGLHYVPVTKEETEKFKQAHSKTAFFIEELREWFNNFFDAYKDTKSIIQVPEVKQEQFEEMRKVTLKIRSFSDCVQAFVSLQDNKYHSPCINGVFGILGACGTTLLLSLAKNKPFRAGVGLGACTELGTGEAYGPGFFDAYSLESKNAQYPRIVIGGHVVNYLGNLINKNQQLPNQTKEDIELCSIMADNCMKSIKRDIDGYPFLDFLGDKFLELTTQHVSDDLKKALPGIFKSAFKFVESEYEKRREAKDQKLASRFFMLHNYFRAREKAFYSKFPDT